MNYLKELNAFYDRLEINPLTTSAIVLWYALMHINNKAAWSTKFTVAVSVLCIKTGLSERSIVNARNELKQKGYIDYAPRKGSQSGVYTIYSIAETIDKTNLSATIADNLSRNASDNLSDNLSGNASALNKLNKTKQKDSSNTPAPDDAQNIFTIVQKEFGRLLSSMEIEQVKSWDCYPTNVVIYAVKKAVLAGKFSIAYIGGILLNWEKNGLRTIQAIQQHEEQYRQQKESCNRKSYSVRGSNMQNCEDETMDIIRKLEKQGVKFDDESDPSKTNN